MDVVEEIPISNLEVFNILKINSQTPIVKEFFEYLKCNQINTLYPLDTLRELNKTTDIHADIRTLAILSNTNYTGTLDEHDRNLINNHFNISNR
jgi:hypothetical protein